MVKFGVAGNSASFYEEGYKTTMESALWCKNRGLDIFEYSFGKGIIMSDKTAFEIGNEFNKYGVEMSIHAPYYINFANPDSEMIQKSINYIINSVKKMKIMSCGNRVVFHPGTQGKMVREEAFNLCVNNIKLLDEVLIDEYSDMVICIETMGKLGQIGTLEEVVKLCNLSPVFYPCIDFGHLYARSLGQLNNKMDFVDIIKYMLDNLPYEKVCNMHIHFSKIMYGNKGEIRHLNFNDEGYGPNFYPLAETISQYSLCPCIICESAGMQAEDAIYMKKLYTSISG